MATHYLDMNTTYQDRYDLAKFTAKVDNSRFNYFDIVDSSFLRKLKDLKKYKTYTVGSEEGRPDLLAERIYGLGQSQFWWVLMILNELRLPKDLKRGMVIRYPTRDSLEGLYLSLNNDSTSALSNLGGDSISTIERVM